MCYKNLPDHFKVKETIDLQNNKRQFWIVNGLALLIGLVLFIVGCLIEDPIDVFVKGGASTWEIVLLFLGLLVALVGYFVLHELTHGLFLYLFTKVRPKFGFVGWAAYCGNDAFCDKPRYLVVALAPLVIWGILFGVGNIFIPSGIWFWFFWCLQIVNISGASGDLFVACKIIRAPKGILVKDTGLAMTVYRPMTAEEISQQDSENVAPMSEEDHSEEENS